MIAYRADTTAETNCDEIQLDHSLLKRIDDVDLNENQRLNLLEKSSHATS
jgi:hypothetical protein